MQNIWDKSTLQPTTTGHLGYAQIPGDFLLISRDAVSGTNLIQVWEIFYTLNSVIPVMSFVMEFQILF